MSHERKSIRAPNAPLNYGTRSVTSQLEYFVGNDGKKFRKDANPKDEVKGAESPTHHVVRIYIPVATNPRGGARTGYATTVQWVW